MLQTACSYVKRRVSGINWEYKVDDEMIVMMQKILFEVKEEDPMSGRWYVPKLGTVMVWCNVSNIVTCNY